MGPRGKGPRMPPAWLGCDGHARALQLGNRSGP